MQITLRTCSYIGCLSTVLAITFLIGMSQPLQAQEIPLEVARFGYADTVFFNGKVVSMDDRSNSTQVGNVYQAMAKAGD